ncbi:MAG: 30S ribosomal protein S7 [Candidatus Cloacimonetes bacterium 4572_55]|nr:MAG: 30S ribosomal protein S7 [Candidatus Cloacimonetes bacterium 4572_55]
MPRRKSAVKRESLPDPLYNSVIVTKFINGLLKGGKRSIAEKIFYGALNSIEKKTGNPGIDVFKTALNNVRPVLEVKSRRVGGATYQVPIEVRPARRASLAIRWLVGCARSRHEHTMAERLANELIAASKNEGGAIKKKDDTHRMAEANRAFSHYVW